MHYNYNYSKSTLIPIQKIDVNGMPIPIDTQPQGATEKRLMELEKFIGTKLPEEYRFFLTAINGGEPSSNFDADRDDTIPDISVFWGVDGNTSSLSESKSIEMINKYGVFSRIPYLFEIGMDGYGRPFCIALWGPQRGSVFRLKKLNEIENIQGDELFSIPNSFEKISDSFYLFYLSFLRGFP